MYKIVGGDGKQYGPVSADEIRAWIAEGRANGKTLVQAEGNEEWKPLSEYSEFSGALAAKQAEKSGTTTPTPPTPVTPATAATPGSPSLPRPDSSTPSAGIPTAPNLPTRYFMLGADNKEYGPKPVEEIRQWVAEGRANAQTPIRQEGSTKWQQVAQVPELAAALGVPGRPSGVAHYAPPTANAGNETNQLALWGMVCGIASLPCSCCGSCLASPIPVVGIVLSGIALSQLSKRPVEGPSKQYAVAGMITSILGLILGIAMAILSFMNNPDLFNQIMQDMQQAQ